jgi:hypothetical protein
MTRRLYLASLLLLQLLLIVEVAPGWGRSLATGTVTVSVHDGWTAVVPLAGAGMALAGSAIALAAPSIALLRHHQRGARRFDGIPRWAARLTIAGAVLFVAASAPWWLARALPVESRVDTLLACAPCITASMALMAAGALCAELLRRGVRPMPPPAATRTEIAAAAGRARAPLPARVG